jgi:general stress protein 26
MTEMAHSEAETTFDGNVQKIAKMIHGIDFAMLTTVNDDGHLHSRPMSTQQVEFDGTVWFFTYEDTPKAQDIRRNPQVNVAYADPKKQDYVSLAGRAEIVKDRAKMEELWEAPLKAWFPQGVDTPGIALIKVTAETAELWDSPTNPVAHLISLAKVAITGKPANPGENVTLDLSDHEDSLTADRAAVGSGV